MNFYKCSLSIHATHIFSSNNVSALIIIPQAFKTYLKSKYFWSAESEVTLSLQINELDVSQQVKQWNAGWTERKLDPFNSMIH